MAAPEFAGRTQPKRTAAQNRHTRPRSAEFTRWPRPKYATWEAMSILTTRKIDEEWTEYTLTRTFSDPNGNRVRYKAEMTGNNLVYPRIHTLGATLS